MKQEINSGLATFVSSLIHRNDNYCHFHSHPVMEIVYHPNGRGITSLQDSSSFSFATDTVIIYWPEVEHDQAVEKAGDDICIQLGVRDIGWLPENRQFIKAEIQGNGFLKQEILSLERVSKNRTANQQKSADLRVTALLIDLISLALEAEHAESSCKKVPDTSVMAYDFIIDNFNTIESINDVAGKVGISYDYLRHQFRDTYGISMKQHLLNTKIEQSTQFLIYSPLSLKQIAEECGFENERYFSTSFKHHTGSTPGEFRKTYSEI